MPGPGIRHDPCLGQPLDARSGIRSGQHHDRGTLLPVRCDFGLEAGLPGPRDEILGQITHRSPDSWNPNLLNQLEPAELGINRGQAGSALFEPARILMPFDVAGIKCELALVRKPSGYRRLERQGELLAHVKEYDTRSTQ